MAPRTRSREPDRHLRDRRAERAHANREPRGAHPRGQAAREGRHGRARDHRGQGVTTGAPRTATEVRMKIWRGEGSAGEHVEYVVPLDPGMVVLDVVHRIQATHAPDLAVRWNCKAGKCGSCSAEVNGAPKLMCMTRMNEFAPGEEITISPVRTFPLIKDLVSDVSFNYEKAKTIPPCKPKPKDADGKRRMYQEDVDRVQEFHKCIECFLCQDVCHVIRDHEENKQSFSGPRFFVRLAALEMHPLDTNDRLELIKARAGLGLCN